jgi:hypothetical protein
MVIAILTLVIATVATVVGILAGNWLKRKASLHGEFEDLAYLPCLLFSYLVAGLLTGIVRMIINHG